MGLFSPGHSDGHTREGVLPPPAWEPMIRDTLPQSAAITVPKSFTGTWAALGELEQPRNACDGLGDPALPPDGPRYRPLRVLGRGGSSTVWLVHDLVLDREVALKVLSLYEGESPDVRARFLFEARLTGSLQMTGVVPVFDAGLLPDGRCYYTMRHIAGPSLADAIEARNERHYGALGTRTLLTVLAQVAQTVGQAHTQGISHRDIKPANILIGSGGEAFLADWGLSGPSEAGLPVSASARPCGGTILSGTLHYMAPEQLDGDGRHLGPVSDVYSLGACLFEILTGTTPHQGATTLSLMFQVRNVDAPDPRVVAPGADINPALAALCVSALSREPRRRHVNARTLGQRLLQALPT